jgi:DNA replication protein DnaC
MPYSKEVFEAATARLAQRRQATEAENAMTRNQLNAKIPRLAKIEHELADTGISVIKEILSFGDTAARIERLRNNNLALQAERAELLNAKGYPLEILAVNHYCAKCVDTGYINDKMCSCLKGLLREEACKRANSGSPLPLYDFKSFDIKYYPETVLKETKITIQDYMARVLFHCRNYALNFNGEGSSLLLLGGTGLGKTHLALAIANTVLGRGFGVIYDTAQNIFMKMEDENFGRSEKKYSSAVLECDLLIIDELPDYASPYSINNFYNIINTRTLAKKPMVVSTNLNESELSARYGERIFSRLIGDFVLLKFFGNDIRQLKLKKKSLF